MKINFTLNRETLMFKKDIKNLFELAVENVGVSADISANVVLVSAHKIRQMNKKYRNVDKATDVLSFPMIDNFDDIENEIDFDAECNVGDIYINLDRAKEQAVEYGHSLKREFCFLALHGFLHLLGFDHIDKEDEKQMLKMQNLVLEKANIGRD